MSRIIQSPGVQITEKDLSLSPSIPRGTDIFVTGFASKGPTDAVVQITSVPEFEQIYGTPTNAAERYLYYTAKQILNGSNGNLLVNRLPYGSGLGDGFGSKYSALVYPTVAFSPGGDVFTNTLNASADSIYFFGAPKLFELTQSEYYNIVQGGITWSNTTVPQSGTVTIAGLTGAATGISSIASFASAGLVVLNKAQATINDQFEGYYVGIIDNTNLLPTTNFDSIVNVQTTQVTAPATGTTAFLSIPKSVLNFAVSSQSDATGTYSSQSLAAGLENTPSFDTFNVAYDDTVSLGVFKLFKSPYAPDTTVLDYIVDESYNASFDYHRQLQNVNGGLPVPYFIGNKTGNSRNITVLVNDYISNRLGSSWINAQTATPSKKVRFVTHTIQNLLTNTLTTATTCSSTSTSATSAACFTNYAALTASIGVNQTTFLSAAVGLGYADSLYPLGAYTNSTTTDKTIGNIPSKIERILSKIDDDEIFNIDLICEAGLGTIYTAACANSTAYYDDTQISSNYSTALNALTSTFVYNPGANQDLRGLYTTIYNTFTNFAEIARKDCLFVADPLRHIFVTGINNKVLNNPSNSFSVNVWAPLRRTFELCNSSYATTYANWAKVNDAYSGSDVWVPFSGFAAADMANTDENFYPWFAPAGYTRGRVQGAIDLAIYPKQKERDQLYKISLNPVTLFPGEGFVIFGQKTLLKKPSAFDRINVRRLFLYVEKATKRTAKYFVFEPNTLFTRTQVVNTLSPIFETVKQTDGVYDYLLVCDERNNTPAVIDQNELVIDVYLKPVRAAEFILVNFYATRTGTNFNELVGG